MRRSHGVKHIQSSPLLVKYAGQKNTKLSIWMAWKHRRETAPFLRIRTLVDQGVLVGSKARMRARRKVNVLLNAFAQPTNSRAQVYWRYTWERDYLRQVKQTIIQQSRRELRRWLARSPKRQLDALPQTTSSAS